MEENQQAKSIQSMAKVRSNGVGGGSWRRRKFAKPINPRFDGKNAGFCPKNELQISLFFSFEQAILSDLQNRTANKVESGVCNYTGVYCAPAPDNPSIRIGSDLNHGDIARYLPEKLGRLTDLGVFHINSNRFCGTVPRKFKNLQILLELD
ncbi:Leucine-rich repeat extensin-like protein 4 [Abeliophyllum distichum]|uniref:Leucine-rich repeat extensin-like protein 4 n=1 Tax=Abeliophyllum distichum TaxID=126358 RepID=A0ABD1Q7U9_9LAMI